MLQPVKRKTANKQKRQVIFERAEKYVQEYRDAEREEIRLKRTAKFEVGLCAGGAQACFCCACQGY